MAKMTKFTSYEDMLKKKAKKEAEKKVKTIKVVYAEPSDYIPEDLRREFKLGEFADPKEEKK